MRKNGGEDVQGSKNAGIEANEANETNKANETNADETNEADEANACESDEANEANETNETNAYDGEAFDSRARNAQHTADESRLVLIIHKQTVAFE